MGNIKVRPEKEIRARYRKLAKRANVKGGPKSKSIRVIIRGVAKSRQAPLIE